MIKRTIYLNRINPFIDKDIIKVITGIRRSGKSVLLQQIQDELVQRGKNKANFIYINFEDLQYESLLNYRKINRELVKRIKQIYGKAYLFLDEIQKVKSWKKKRLILYVPLIIAISTLLVQILNYYQVS